MKQVYPLDQWGSFAFWPVGIKSSYDALDRTAAGALSQITQKTNAVGIIT